MNSLRSSAGATKIKALIAASIMMSGGFVYYQYAWNGGNPENDTPVAAGHDLITEKTETSGVLINGKNIEVKLGEEEAKMLQKLIDLEYEAKVMRSEEEKKKKNGKKKEVIIF